MEDQGNQIVMQNRNAFDKIENTEELVTKQKHLEEVKTFHQRHSCKPENLNIDTEQLL